MPTPSKPVRAAVFSILTLLVSWVCWVPHLSEIRADLFQTEPRVLVWFFVGAYAPFITALALTGIFDGRHAVRDLLKSLFSAFRGGRWSLVGFAVGPVVAAVALWLYSRSGTLGTFNQGALPWIPVIFAVCVIFGPLAEELGWRGYLLPALKFADHPIRATAIVATVWAIWHAPLFWAATGTAISGAPVTPATLTLFTVGIFAWSAVYSWIAHKTGGSIFAAVMVHLGANGSGAVLGILFPEMDPTARIDLHEWSVAILSVLVGLTLVISHLRTAVPRSDRTPIAAP